MFKKLFNYLFGKKEEGLLPKCRVLTGAVVPVKLRPGGIIETSHPDRYARYYGEPYKSPLVRNPEPEDDASSFLTTVAEVALIESVLDTPSYDSTPSFDSSSSNDSYSGFDGGSTGGGGADGSW